MRIWHPATKKGREGREERMGAVIIGWTAVAIIVGVIAQRGLGRTGLAWGLATLALEITLASFVKGQPPAGMPQWAYDIGGFVVTGGVALVLVMAALFTMPKPRRQT
jgi:uncharacterized membrane protein YkgB